MPNFRVFPIPNSVALSIREKRVDDFGHRLSVSAATENDTGPCRSCLTVFVPGEGRILFSYAPNQHDHPYNEVGPIYIHKKIRASCSSLLFWRSLLKSSEARQQCRFLGAIVVVPGFTSGSLYSLLAAGIGNLLPGNLKISPGSPLLETR